MESRFYGISSSWLIGLGCLVLWLSSAYPLPGHTAVIQSRLTSSVRVVGAGESSLPSSTIFSSIQSVQKVFTVELAELSASGSQGSWWSLPRGEVLAVTAEVVDARKLQAVEMCAGASDYEVDKTRVGGTVCTHLKETIKRCTGRMWREFIASQSATDVVGLDIKLVNRQLLSNMTSECQYPGIRYVSVSVSKPHAPDDDSDEKAAYALKRPIYEQAAEANRSIVATQALAEKLLAESRAEIDSIQTRAKAEADVAAAATLAKLKVIEANATLQAASIEAEALRVRAAAELVTERNKAAQRQDEFSGRLAVISSMFKGLQIKPDAQGLAAVIRAATWAHRSGGTFLSEGASLATPLLNATA